jgi:hypothetical protein
MTQLNSDPDASRTVRAATTGVGGGRDGDGGRAAGAAGVGAGSGRWMAMRPAGAKCAQASPEQCGA